MKLSHVSRYFNKTPCTDSYTGVYLFNGQLDVFDDSKRDGLTAQRRIFEVAPGTVIPERRTIRFADVDWLVGIREIDQFLGRTLREKYVLHQAEQLAHVQDLAQVLSDADGLHAYSARVWVRADKQIETSSAIFNQVNLYFSAAEPVAVESVVTFDDQMYFVREVYHAAAGHLAALSEELEPGAVEVGLVKTSGAWDPISQSYPEVNTPVRLVKLRWQAAFEYFSQKTQDFERGDMQAATLSDIAAGAEIELVDGKWRVHAVQERGAIHMMHLRRSV